MQLRHIWFFLLKSIWDKYIILNKSSIASKSIYTCYQQYQEFKGVTEQKISIMLKEYHQDRNKSKKYIYLTLTKMLNIWYIYAMPKKLVAILK